MQMTPNEIVKSYKEAKEKKKQIQILSELNCCSTADIKQILRDNGVEFPGPNPKKATERTEKATKIKVPAAVRTAVIEQLKDINEKIKSLEENIETLRNTAEVLKTWLKAIE